MSADHRRAGFWCEHQDARPHWERARPLLPVLQGLLRGTGWSVVHAAGIAADPTRAILLSGASRAGKTSLALRALADGWAYFGDDVVAISTADSPVRVARIYDTARLRLPPLAGLESLALDGSPSRELGENRRELQLGARLASHPMSGIVQALVHVTRGGSLTPTFGSVSRAEVVSTMVSTTLSISFADLSHLPAVTQLASKVRPLRFDPGADLTSALQALRQVVHRPETWEATRP